MIRKLSNQDKKIRLETAGGENKRYSEKAIYRKEQEHNASENNQKQEGNYWSPYSDF